MSRFTWAGLAGLVLLTFGPAAVPAKALVMAPSPIPMRVAGADAVVVGKVIKIEDKTVKAPRFEGDREMGEYKIAVIKVEDGILNARGITHVRVGFIPPPPAPPPGPRGRPIRILPGRGRMMVHYEVGLDGLFFLQRHPFATFYETPMYFSVVKKKGNPQFAKELAESKRAAKILAEPMKSLKARDMDTRLEAAAMLITKYRTAPRGVRSPRQEAVGAEESKAILAVLAEANWDARPKPGTFGLNNPYNLFSRLGVTNKDGFTRPRNAREFKAAAKKWVAGHADSYRIKKFVAPPREGEE
jgi:hypothetical protein